MNKADEKKILQETYAVMAELWVSPQDVDMEKTRKEAKRITTDLEPIHQEGASLLSKFLNEKTVLEEEYIDLFELAPKCSLYLGSHLYEEPTTCAGAAVSDRNDYMIELIGIYKHFGQNLKERELPDYLPLMLDFLSLSLERNADPVREKFINKYILPFLPPMRKKLEEVGTPYLYLLDALESVINYELKTKHTVN